MKLRTMIRGLGYAESPRWHQGQLWFVDFFSGQVLRGGLEGSYEAVAKVENMPGGLGFLPDGTPLVVSQRDFRILRIGRDGALSDYADLSAYAVGAANELFVDPAGLAYVGHHGFDFFGGAEPRPSSLLRVDTGGSVSVAADGLIFPNGTALLPGGKTLIVAESFANRLTAFDIAEDGSLSNQRVWAQLGGHTPDGICVDAEGAVWAGSPLTSTFVRVREGGEIADEIRTEDGRWAVACAFAGDDLETLCCITAATSLEDMPQGRSEAFVELADVAVPGART
ncbi:MAG: SMP-30/gluconolactonase/LRE family protein [Allosphingosinicella sp.]